MVINDFHVIRMGAFPAEANAVLIIDADAVLSFAIARKLLQAVARRNAEIVERFSGIQEQQFPQRRALKRARQFAAPFAVEKTFGLGVPEAANHAR